MWTDAQEPHVAMAASVVLAALITVIGLSGVIVARRFASQETLPL
jgi:hypothetical protein